MKKKTNELIDVQDPDLLVIGGRQPLVQAAAIASEAAGASAVVAIGAPYCTVSVPVMFGWTVHTNVYGAGGQRRDVVGLRSRAGDDLALERPWSPLAVPAWIATLCGSRRPCCRSGSGTACRRAPVSVAASKAVFRASISMTVSADRWLPGGACPGRRSGRRRPAGGVAGAAPGRCAPGATRRSRPGSGRGPRRVIIRWPTPHSSAHWPRKVWPASLGWILKSNCVDPAGDDVALEEELRHVERVDDVAGCRGTGGSSRRPGAPCRRPRPAARAG